MLHTAYHIYFFTSMNMKKSSKNKLLLFLEDF